LYCTINSLSCILCFFYCVKCDTPTTNEQIKNDRPERKRSITQTVMAAIFQKKVSPNKMRSPSSHQTSPSRFKFLISGKTKEKSQVILYFKI